MAEIEHASESKPSNGKLSRRSHHKSRTGESMPRMRRQAFVAKAMVSRMQQLQEATGQGKQGH